MNLAADLFARIQASPWFWAAASVCVRMLQDDTGVVTCLQETLHSGDRTHLESLLELCGVLSGKLSQGLVRTLMRIVTDDRMEMRLRRLTLDVLAASVNAGASVETISRALSDHAHTLFKEGALSSAASQLLFTLQRWHSTSSSTLQAALESCPTSSRLLRLSYLADAAC